MSEKRSVDAFGAAALIGFAMLLAFNQVVIKITGGGFGPLFQAGLRSAGAIVVIGLWMRLAGIPFAVPEGAFRWGVLSGVLFAYEFVCLFFALDLTTVSRASIMFYTMPVWLALAAHFVLPGERLNGTRALGLVAAMAGVVLALSDRSDGNGNLLGDLLALVGTLGWAGIALLVRITPLSGARPEMQLLFQVVVSAAILMPLALALGDTVRAPQAVHFAGLAFQIIGVASLGFLVWFKLMRVYKASGVASFSFLSPVFAVLFGWAILGETIGPRIWAAMALVALGLVLINRK